MDDFPYGGYNDKALCLVEAMPSQRSNFCLRAYKDTGKISIGLDCNDIFAWACADSEELPDQYWDEFRKTYRAALKELKTDDALKWYAQAWAVKIRGVAPQKPATDEHPNFVKMLDWLNVPWREMKRYDEMDTQ